MVSNRALAIEHETTVPAVVSYFLYNISSRWKRHAPGWDSPICVTHQCCFVPSAHAKVYKKWTTSCYTAAVLVGLFHIVDDRDRTCMYIKHQERIYQ
jgi:hypothetical protein